MYILLGDKIIQLDLHYIKGFEVQKVYCNHIDDDSKSGFKYNLVAKNSNSRDYDKTIKQYDDIVQAYKDLEIIAERIGAIMLNK